MLADEILRRELVQEALAVMAFHDRVPADPAPTSRRSRKKEFPFPERPQQIFISSRHHLKRNFAGVVSYAEGNHKNLRREAVIILAPLRERLRFERTVGLQKSSALQNLRLLPVEHHDVRRAFSF